MAFNAKTLVIAMAIPFSLLLPVLFYGKHRPFGVHVVFAAHVYAFLLLLWSASVGIAEIDVLRGGVGLDAAWMDNVLTVGNVAVCALYLYFAIGRVYRSQGLARLATSLVLAMGVQAVAIGYRFGLLLLTLSVV